MATMTYAEAAQHVRQMANVFQSFEHLENILSLVGGAERVLAEIEQRIQTGRAVAEEWIRRDEATKATFERDIAALSAQLASLRESHANEMTALAAAEAALREEIGGLTAQRDALQRAVDDLRRVAAGTGG